MEARAAMTKLEDIDDIFITSVPRVFITARSESGILVSTTITLVCY